jgi:FkbM family methyltransferase
MFKSQKLIKDIFKFFGLIIRKTSPSSDHDYLLALVLKKLSISLVFDIGANEGQFAKGLRSYGYDQKIISFEPLSQAHKILSRVSHSDQEWTIHERCAIGGRTEVRKIFISQNSVSSSLLKINSKHKNAAPASTAVAMEDVQVYPLSAIIEFEKLKGESKFLKLDVQGFEHEILDELDDRIKEFTGVICELSIVTLYENQKTWTTMLNYFESNGFVLWSLIPGFIDYKSGQTLQVDGLFVRKDQIKILETGKL